MTWGAARVQLKRPGNMATLSTGKKEGKEGQEGEKEGSQERYEQPAVEERGQFCKEHCINFDGTLFPCAAADTASGSSDSGSQSSSGEDEGAGMFAAHGHLPAPEYLMKTACSVRKHLPPSFAASKS